MGNIIQHLRGSVVDHSIYTGKKGEISLVTDASEARIPTGEIRIHDDSTPGGLPIVLGTTTNPLTSNIVLGSGVGINFHNYGSEDSNSATIVGNNLLDDYEEGVWTPAFSISVSGSITMSLQEGVYAKIGKTVFISCRVSTSSISSPLGILQITGLPFTSGNQTRFACTIADMRAWATAFTTPVTATIEGSSTAVTLTKQATNDSFGGVLGSDMSVSSGGNNMQVAGFYTI